MHLIICIAYERAACDRWSFFGTLANFMRLRRRLPCSESLTMTYWDRLEIENRRVSHGCDSTARLEKNSL